METNVSIIDHFSEISDPRIDRTKLHKLIEIIVIAICAVICGAQGYDDIEDFGKSSETWLNGLLELKNGIPSHDTFRRVFIYLNPFEFEKCFLSWINAIAESTAGDVVAIDGKTLRRSFDKKSQKSAIHMVSAWSNANNVVLGQLKVNDKSNEITAIPELLKLLELKGCIITIDAMGCQKKIVKEIRIQGGEYNIALKQNQANLFKQTTEFFKNAEKENFKGLDIQSYTTDENGHGRKETRDYYMVTDIDWLKKKNEWKDLNSLGLVISKRTQDNKTSIEKRFYISSLKNIEDFSRSVRDHWGIENKLHWVLDVQMREDGCRKRTGSSSENFAILRHIALNFLRQEKSLKRGIEGKRFKAAVDVKYREKVLFGS